jgi:hypothetical protein
LVRHAAQERSMMLIVGIEDLAPLLARAHHAQLTQVAHVVRHRRFADAGGLGQRADVCFAAD